MRLAFMSAPGGDACEARRELAARYGEAPVSEAEVVVALGGDGHMLETLRGAIGSGRPIYGMNRGTVGFLMNEYQPDDLPQRIRRGQPVTLYPLRMRAVGRAGSITEDLAINEVSLFRADRKSTRLNSSH